MNKLLEMNQTFPQTQLWTDSFQETHQQYGLQNGALGITTSPTWVSRMILAENHFDKVQALLQQYPHLNEQEMLWKLTLQLGKQRSQIMLPLYNQGNPQNGRYSIQTNIHTYNNFEQIVKDAIEINALAPNMQVKIPATPAGIKAMEEATYLGISVMATTCLTIDQALAVAEAIEKGLNRRTQENKNNHQLNPMCAMLLGMQDDYLKVEAEAKQLAIDPDALNWAGVAVTKKAHKIYQQRGYRTRLLVAYYRSKLHWSEFIGGNIVMTIPEKWQKRFINCDLVIEDRMSIPVDQMKMAELNKLSSFVKSYTEGCYPVEQFLNIPTVILTLHYFLDEYEKALHKIREWMLVRPTSV